jgi:putative hemolysin
MSEIPLEIDIVPGLITIGVLLVFNAILAMAEVALISARKARLQSEINKGDTRAIVALKLVEDPNQFLSVIQIGITSIDLMTGALAGATIGVWINFQLDKIPSLQAYSQIISILIGILPITYLSLVLGELVPKRLAMPAIPSMVGNQITPARVMVPALAPPLHSGLRMPSMTP